MAAKTRSVWGWSIASTGLSRPTQMVTRRPWLSMVTEAHSRAKRAEAELRRLPSGPAQR